jgi:hypothetical protein
MLKSLFRGARSQTSRRSPLSRRRSFLPRLEFLEDRLTPSTLTATNLNDTGIAGDGSLRGEIAAAAPGDTINFATGLSGTLGLSNDLAVDHNVTILGNLNATGGPLVTLSRGNAPYAVDLVVNGGVTASVFGLAFTGGESQAVTNSGTLTLDHVAITGNWVGGNESGPTGDHYGTVYNSGTLVVRNSQITNNIVFSYERGGGGGIYSTGTLTVADTTVSDNEAFGGYAGGAILVAAGTATITDSTISGNQGPYGGGIATGDVGLVNFAGPLTVSGCTISGNKASYDGGGMYCGGTATISRCVATGNTAEANGGGIAFYAGVPGSLTLCDSTVANNLAGGTGSSAIGGGVCVAGRGTAVAVVNCTIAGNTVRQFQYSGHVLTGTGGGIGVQGGSTLWAGGTLTLVSSTVAGNGADTAGGGLWVSTMRTRVSLTNTLIAGNTAPTSPDACGPILASASNLIGNGDGSSGLINGTLGNQVGTTASPIDPKLGPLQINGGSTPTMAIQSGSPALDTGSNTNSPDYDQRGTGFARVVGAGIDIGAFEAQPAGVMTHFGITSSAGAVAGTPFATTFLAFDDFSNLAPGYVGSVHLAVTDGPAVLTQDYALRSADAATHTFSVTLKTAGTQVFTVSADTPAGPMTMTMRGSLTVSPAAATSLRLSAPATATAGQAVSATLTLQDGFGNLTTGYTGTVHITSSDARAVLPVNYTFTSADAGTHTFSVTLKTAGSQSITATDTVTGSVTGTAGIVVSPAAAAKLVLTMPASVMHGAAFSLTLTVQDAYGNVVTGYTGSVHFTSSDGAATMPANYTFTAADAGVHTFANAAILRKRGTQTVTVTDLATGGLTVTNSINVT